MKTLNKTLLSLTFLTFILTGFTQNAQADCMTRDCETSEKRTDPTTSSSASDESEFDFDFSEPFFFNDKVIISIYGEEDKLLYSGSFTKEEMQKSTELKSWLKKSDFLLSIDNQQYYLVKK